MNDIVLPLYLALALLFIGITIAGRPGSTTTSHPRGPAEFYGQLGGVMAALACVCIALVPVVGRGLLPVSTLLLWVSFVTTTLRVRAWRTTVSPRFAKRVFALLTGLIVLMVTQFLLEPVQLRRVIFQYAASLGLLAWMVQELRLLAREQSSAQLRLMLWSALGVVMVLSWWAWALTGSEARDRLLQVSPLFSEASLAFAMRLFTVAMVALLLIGANGFNLERMARQEAHASHQHQRVDELNQQLQRALVAKNEMLQALAFKARAQNLPAIMNSLSHEISQPLGAIRLNADLLLAEHAQMPAEELSHLVQQLAHGSQAAHAVVHDFRRFFAGAGSPQVMVNVPELIADVVRGLHADFSRQQIWVSVDEGGQGTVLGDPIQLEAALVGMVRFMQHHCRGQQQTLHLGCTEQGTRVQLRVRASGLSLPASICTQAFERHVHSDHFSQNLWLSRAIIEHHGGSMDLHIEGGDTCVNAHIPKAKDHSNA